MESLIKASNEETPQVKNVFLFAIYTGMRKSELLMLKWSHIKWEKGQVEIVQHKSKSANE